MIKRILLFLLPVAIYARSSAATVDPAVNVSSSTVMSSEWKLAGHPDWYACQSDEQCTIVWTPCQFPLAVNKEHGVDASHLGDDACLHSGYTPKGTFAKCRNNECVLIIPKDK